MLIEVNDINRLAMRNIEPALDASPGMITGMGFLPLLLAAIPAVAAAGMSIFSGIKAGQDAKKVAKKQALVDKISAQQQTENAMLQSQIQQLQDEDQIQTRNLLIKSGAGIAAIAASIYLFRKI